MKINLLPKKTWKQTLWKGINVVSSITLIVNMTMVGVFIAPQTASATTPSWPSDSQWVVPICNDDPTGDESPDEIDLDASGSQYGAAYFTDASTLYLRERVDGNPGTPGNWHQYAWVFMIQKDIATTNYDFLVSLRGSGQGENVELWQNTTQNGPIDWSPIFNDPAETQLATWDTSANSRVMTTGNDYYVDWKIPLSELTSRGVNLLNSGLYWATSTNANNYNKDHLNCYNAPDLRLNKEVRKNNSGSWFTDGRTAGVQAAPGDTLNYRVTVTNAGGPTSGATAVADELGRGDATDGNQNINPATQYSDWMSILNPNSDGNSNPFTGSWGDGSSDGQINDTLTLSIPLISGGGASEQFAFDAVVRNDIPVGTHLFENTTAIPANQLWSETDIQVVRTGQCVLTIDKSVINYDHPNGPNVPGDRLLYTLNFSNSGSADCTGGGVRVDDAIPANTTYTGWHDQSANVTYGYGNNKFGNANPNGFNGSLLSWNAGTLTPGESGWVKFKVTVRSLESCEQIDVTNKGKIFADQVPNGIWSNEVSTHFETTCYGSLKVTKYVDNGSATPDQWSFTTNGQTLTPTAGTNYVIFNDLLPGNYTVTESNLADYHQVSSNCDNVNVSANNQATCEFHNTRDTGDFTIYKYDESGAPQEGVTFDIAGPANQNGQTNANGVLVFSDIPTGAYTVSETEPQYYDFLSVSGACSPNDNPTNVTITTDGQSCTFTNTRQMGEIHVYKNVFGPNGEDVTDDHHTFYVQLNGDSETEEAMAEPTPWVSYTVPLGITQTVTENNDPDYTLWLYHGDEDGATPGAQITLTEDNPIKNIVIKNKQKPVLVTSCKQIDADGNLETTEDQTAKVGWTVHLSKNGQTIDTQVTDENGCYTWSNLLPGFSYDTSEEVPTGWTALTPTSHDFGMAYSNNSFSYTFINFQNFNISGLKFHDVDGDGIQDAEESGLADWTIFLDENGNDTLDAGEISTVTDANGEYSFTDLGPGTYTVREVQQNGWTQTTTNPADIQAVSGTDVDDVDFGNFRNAFVTACKFVDADGNLETTGDQTAKVGWTVHLSKNGQTIDTQVTDENGCYTWSNLLPGFSYDTSEEVPTGWTALTPTSHDFGPVVSGGEYSYTFINFENINVTICKYVDVNGDGDISEDPEYTSGWPVFLNDNYRTTEENGCYTYTDFGPGNYDVTEGSMTGWTQTHPTEGSYNFNAVSGEDRTFKFGNFQEASVTVTKLIDADENLETTGDQTPKQGWTVQLWKDGVQVGGDEVTGLDGTFTWNDLEPGNYTVKEIIPLAYYNALGPTEYSFSAESGQHYDYTFINFEYGKISGYKYDTQENPLNDWEICLSPEVKGFTIDSIAVSNCVLTGSGEEWNDGYYEFTGIHAGNYIVSETLKDYWTQIEPDGDGVHHISVQSGTDSTNNDFVNFHNTEITGMKFNDVNGDGIKDSGDNGVENWIIKLYKWDDGEEEYSFQTQTTTDSNGNYSFTNLGPGTYKVEEGQQDDWVQTYPEDPNYYDGIELTSGTPVTGQDFGNFELGKISGYKYDWDTENKLDNWQICLTGGDLEVPQCVWTGDNDWPTGYYEFTGLYAGDYTVSEITQYGWTIMDPISNTHNVTVQSGTGIGGEAPSYDFWNRRNAFEVSIEKSATETVNAGDQMIYTLDWEVTGNTPVYNASVTDELPANTTFVSADNGGTYDSNTNTVTWDLGTVTPEDDGMVTFTVQVATPLTDGTEIENTGVICGTGDIIGESVLRTISEVIEEPQGVEKCDYDDTTTEVNSDFTVDIEKTGQETVEAGEQITYTLTWAVTGNSPIDNLVITDAVPANTTFVSADNGGTEAAGTVTWNLGAHLPGDNGLVTLVVQTLTPLNNGTIIENTGLICGQAYTLTEQEVIEHCDDDTTTTTTHSIPVLGLEKTAPAQVNAGDNIDYTITWSISGNSQATQVVLTDPVPADTTFVSADQGGVYDAGTNTVTWDLGTKQPGDTGTVHMVVQTNSPLPDQTTILNIATLDSLETDPEIVAQATTVIVSGPILAISKSVDASTANAGDNLTYTVNWSVTGNGPAHNVTLTDPIPANTTFVSADNGATYDATTKTISWSLGTVMPDLSGTYTVVVKTDSPLASDTVITNIATIDSDETEPLSDDATTTVQSAPVLGIEKVVDVTTFVNPGATVNYTVTIKNTGTDAAVNVQLTDLLPAGFTFTDFGGSSHTWTLGNLAAGAETSVTYKVTVGAAVTAGIYDNLAVASADNHGNVTDKVGVEVRLPTVLGDEALPKLVIEKSVDKIFINPGDSATYKIKITNTGDAPAINVQLQDVLPAGFTFENKDITKVWTLGDIAEGASVEVSYKAISDKTILPGTYENLAVAWADNHDKVTDSVKLEVRKVQVLGAELPKTGATPLDLVYFFVAGMVLVFSLFVMRLTISREE